MIQNYILQKWYVPLSLLLVFSNFSSNSCLSQNTLILQPGPIDGKDAGLYENAPNSNQGSNDQIISYYWTFTGNEAAGFSLLEFDLSSLPANVQIQSADLSLYYNPTSGSAGHAGDNACYLKKVTSPWDENVVTWNTMPSVTTVDQVYLPTSTTTNQDYPNIDITNFVTDWYNNPSSNYGMKLELIDQSLYNSMKFCSSDYADSLLRPKLVITYIEESVNENDTCVVRQPGPIEGKDVALYENAPNSNQGSNDQIISYYWTFTGNEAAGFSLLEFDLSFLPTNIQINSADLSLYYNPTSGSAGQAGNNACYLKKVTSPWDENVVTWNTMPSVTTVDQVYLPTSTTTNQDYPNIDITNFVTDWYNNPSSNYGMKLELIDQSLYNSMKFCSSDYADSLLRPKLEICYTILDANINELSVDELEVNVFPNPGNGVFNIDFNFIGPIENVKMEVYNSIGQLVYNQESNISPSNKTEKIDLSNFERGIYYIKIIHDNTIIVKQVVLR